MFSQSVKVFLACAFGAGIGSLVALQVATMFWWVGLLVGGLSGYLSYEWKEVIKAIPKAYRAATNFRFPKGFFKAVALVDASALSLSFWFFALFGILAIFVRTNPRALELGSPYWFALAIVANQLALLVNILPPDKDYSVMNKIAGLKRFNYAIFPPIVIFWHLPKGIAFVAKRTPSFTAQFYNDCIRETKKMSRLFRRFWRKQVLRISLLASFLGQLPHRITKWILCRINESILIAKKPCRFLKRFCWELFLRIHSEIRLLCGIDAMIGTAIGYFAGSAIIGALVGGLFGVLNYAVITELCLKRLGYLPIKE